MSRKVEAPSDHNDHYGLWLMSQPKGKYENDSDALRAYYDEQEKRLNYLNKSAAVAGSRAQWAIRQLRVPSASASKEVQS